MSNVLYNKLLATVRLCFHAQKGAPMLNVSVIFHRRKNRTGVRTDGNLPSANRAKAPWAA